VEISDIAEVIANGVVVDPLADVCAEAADAWLVVDPVTTVCDVVGEAVAEVVMNPETTVDDIDEPVDVNVEFGVTVSVVNLYPVDAVCVMADIIDEGLVLNSVAGVCDLIVEADV